MSEVQAEGQGHGMDRISTRALLRDEINQLRESDPDIIKLAESALSRAHEAGTGVVTVVVRQDGLSIRVSLGRTGRLRFIKVY